MQTIVVQKFGGTSVGTPDRIRHVAQWALDTQARGKNVVVVVSAMSGETNRLVALAHEINPNPYSREYDLLISSGEQVAVGLVTLAINTEARSRGLIAEGRDMARGFLGHQIGMRTDQIYSKARIQTVDTAVLRRELRRGAIPVVAGFQGVDSENNITTLGRGGSDTSAVAVAAALQREGPEEVECEIYTDVDGVYTTDPRLCPEARKIPRISYEEMMELASLGAKVLQIRSVEIAANHQVVVHVRSSFTPEEGTRVVPKEQLGSSLEQVVVAGVAADADQTKFTLHGLEDSPGVAAQIFGRLSEKAIVVDVIVQSLTADGQLALSFTVGSGDARAAEACLKSLCEDPLPTMTFKKETDLAKVSIVGVGMQHHPGVAARMFKTLAETGANVRLISTSEIKISCLIDQSRAKEAVSRLHQEFELDRLR